MISSQQHPVTADACQAEIDDKVWLALSDISRRHILDLLRQQSMITREICEHFETSRFAIMKHLKVLVDSGLVTVERRGRERINHLNPVPLQIVYRRWIRPFDQLPADRLLRLKKIAEEGAQ